MNRQSRWSIALPLCLVTLAAAVAQAQAEGLPRLKVSDNGRFLVKEDGTGFFYLADTAWELFHRLDRDEAEVYLEDRASKGFTVIQAVALAEHGGLTVPNAYGHTPLIENDPARPNGAYFQHVDDIVTRAEQLGMYVGLLPTWGDKVNKKWGQGPEIFTPENARSYGQFLGTRYRDKAVIWILGGDRPIESDRHLEIWRAMAESLRESGEGRHLITYHPMGGQSSAEWLHDEPWLDFNMLQSGHGARDNPNYAAIAADYARRPVKPCLDGEPCYEDHPINWMPESGWFDAWDVRKAAYWALFAGGCGHTYGCHDIWQFWPGTEADEKHPPVSHVRTAWRQALELPGASQVQHARWLLESRPYLDRIPDPSLIAGGQGQGAEHVQATRAADGSYALVYIPTGNAVTIDLSLLSGEMLSAWWYNPRDGSAQPLDPFARRGTRDFTPPSRGAEHDWVLVLDDLARDYPEPGEAAGKPPAKNGAKNGE